MGGVPQKGHSLNDDWFERAASISPSIPTGIHDRHMSDSHIQPRPDDEFSRLCKDVKRDFDKAMKADRP